jgi:glycosyltransferase involved in cell wall biosynthesis
MEYSVLMAIYKEDNPEYLRLSLESIVKQTKLPDEIVIVKDGQVTEEIQSVIDEIALHYQSLIVEVQLPNNVGLGLALNEGLKVCKNDLVARMDADDISLPERCEKQVRCFEIDPDLDIVGCCVKEFINSTDNVIGVKDVPLTNDEIYKYAKRRDPFNHPTVMYRKSKVLLYGPYGNYRKNQDTALWIDMISNNCKCMNLPEYLLFFRFNENTYKKRKSWVNTKLLIYIRYKAWRNGFCSFFDFMLILMAQLGIFIMPLRIIKFIYRNILRKEKHYDTIQSSNN